MEPPPGGSVVPVSTSEKGVRRCIACAAELDLELIRNRVDVFGYLSQLSEREKWPRTAGALYAITNFMGFPLLAVTELAGVSGGYTGRALAYSAVDADQKAWFGRTSAVGRNTRARPKKQGERWLLRGHAALKKAQEEWLRQARQDASGAWLVKKNPWRKNSDASLRGAHRAWTSHGEREGYERYVRERNRSGFMGTPAPDAGAARALLAAWPRFKAGKRKGSPKRKITYAQAKKLIDVYFRAAGWLEKIYLRPGPFLSFPETHYQADEYRALPKGFPEERDPNWQPIQFSALISPDFGHVLSTLGRNTAIIYEWDEDHYSSDDSVAWPLEEGDLSNVVDKKALALRLLDASLRVEDPYHPNPRMSSDEELRRLERSAAAGDELAEDQLLIERCRRGQHQLWKIPWIGSDGTAYRSCVICHADFPVSGL